MFHDESQKFGRSAPPFWTPPAIALALKIPQGAWPDLGGFVRRQSIIAAFLSAAALAISYPVSAGAEASGQCRTATMQDNISVVLCKDSSGRWRPSDEQPARAERNQAGGMPARAEITYSGNWSALATNTRRPNFRAPQRNAKDISGPITLVVHITGQQVTSSLTGRYFRNQAMSGTRIDGYCRLAQTSGPDTVEGRCDQNGFSGRIAGSSVDGFDFSGAFEGSTLKFVDVEKRDMEQAVAQRAAAAQAAAQEAAYRALPNAGPVLTKRLDGWAATDSRGWVQNKYDTGSMSNVKIISGSAKSGNFAVKGFYTFNGGARGSVTVNMANNKFQCIQFWDSYEGCRVLRSPNQPPRGFAGSGSAGRADSREDCNDDCRSQAWSIRQYNDQVHQQQEQQQREAAPPPY